MWPESSLAVSFVGAFAVCGELQSLDYEYGIDDCFRPEAPCFGEVFIVSSQTEEVEPSSTSILIRVLNLNLLLRLKFKIQRELDLAGTGSGNRLSKSGYLSQT